MLKHGRTKPSRLTNVAFFIEQRWWIVNKMFCPLRIPNMAVRQSPNNPWCWSCFWPRKHREFRDIKGGGHSAYRCEPFQRETRWTHSANHLKGCMLQNRKHTHVERERVLEILLGICQKMFNASWNYHLHRNVVVHRQYIQHRKLKQRRRGLTNRNYNLSSLPPLRHKGSRPNCLKLCLTRWSVNGWQTPTFQSQSTPVETSFE